MRTSTIQPPTGTPINRSHILFPTAGAWLTNEGGGQKIFDSTGKTNLPGALVNGAIFKKSAKGNCLSFDGVNDYGKISNLNLTGCNQISISVWVKYTTSTGVTLFEHGADYNSNIDTFFLGLNTVGAGYIEFGTSSTGGNGFNSIYTTTASYNDGKWHHVVATVNRQLASANQLFIYGDGVLDTTQNASNTNIQTANFLNNDLYIASRAGTSLFASVLINNIMIWKRALSSTEIRQLYANPYSMFKNKNKSL